MVRKGNGVQKGLVAILFVWRMVARGWRLDSRYSNIPSVFGFKLFCFLTSKRPPRHGPSVSQSIGFSLVEYLNKHPYLPHGISISIQVLHSR